MCGFCCGTLSDADALTHDSMSNHVPDGALLCIHSVCVAEAQRRQGLATRCGAASAALRCTHAFGVVTRRDVGSSHCGASCSMLAAYVAYVQQTTPGIEQIRLITKPLLVELYKGARFAVVGPSAVVHGADAWVEMVLEL